MYHTCLRFIPKGFFECLIEAKPTELILVKFGIRLN